MMKIRLDNNMIDHTGEFYVENDIEMAWLIGPGVVCDENKTWQRRDPSYKCSVCQKWYWTIVIIILGIDYDGN